LTCVFFFWFVFFFFLGVVANSNDYFKGNGVFLRGFAKKGSIVALYKGIIYTEGDLALMWSQICPGNEYVSKQNKTKQNKTKKSENCMCGEGKRDDRTNPRRLDRKQSRVANTSTNFIHYWWCLHLRCFFLFFSLFFFVNAHGFFPLFALATKQYLPALYVVIFEAT